MQAVLAQRLVKEIKEKLPAIDITAEEAAKNTSFGRITKTCKNLPRPYSTGEEVKMSETDKYQC